MAPLLIVICILIQSCGTETNQSKEEDCAYYYRDVTCKYYSQESSHLYSCNDGSEYFGALGVRHECKQVQK
jgi:hypothetical protein